MNTLYRNKSTWYQIEPACPCKKKSERIRQYERAKALSLGYRYSSRSGVVGEPNSSDFIRVRVENERAARPPFKLFTVNIGVGDPEGRGDISVHFNVRLPQQYVVRNTRRHDKWGLEETTAFRLFPFKMDRPFTIEVLVEEKETLWAVDGEHYCSFSHRNPSPLAATWVQVAGVRNATLQIGKTSEYPTLAAPPVEVPLRPSVDAPPESLEINCWRPNVIATLSNGVPEGHQIVIHGRLRPLLHSFAIDLMDYAREWPFPNILMHANVRAHVESQKDRQLVVFNAWLGAWGPERRQRTARLVPGSKCTFKIIRGGDEWSVYADDVLIGELEYRAAPAGVKAIRVRGDFYPDDIYLCPATSSPIREQISS
ncbi:hypothetical protein evm_000033 [Chilo suppressalis]|nr:hypothetical protein evm_000033 [Chilo suppressalis]